MASMTLPPYKDSTLKTFVKAVKQPNKTFNPSLQGKTCLITGANSGIGLACAQILPTLGVSHLIIGVRTVSKGEAAIAPIRKAHPNVKIEVWQLDMLSYESVQRFAKWCDGLGKLDIAILNAGIGFNMPSKNDPKTGHEETIQVNYLSTTLLSILLLPILARHSQNEPGRLLIVGSGTALFSSFPNINADPILPAFDKPYNGFAEAMEQYSGSKVLVLMLVHTLSQLVPADSVIINTVEPGLTSNTNLHGNSSGGGAFFMNLTKKATAKTPEQAAQTYINAIGVHGRESHGGFLQFFEVGGMPKLMHTDDGRRFMERLWKETMAELEFARAKEVLESVGRQKGVLMFNAVSSF